MYNIKNTLLYNAKLVIRSFVAGSRDPSRYSKGRPSALAIQDTTTLEHESQDGTCLHMPRLEDYQDSQTSLYYIDIHAAAVEKHLMISILIGCIAIAIINIYMWSF